jgi:hypothetical protein
MTRRREAGLERQGFEHEVRSLSRVLGGRAVLQRAQVDVIYGVRGERGSS